MLSRRRAAIAAQWILLGAAVGVACGIASGIFLLALESATRFRTQHEIIVYFLPLAGLVIGALYQWLGTPIRGGYNLVLDTLHTDGAQVPIRMAPMVLVGTVLTHLFGGSAGREGTAVQMGRALPTPSPTVCASRATHGVKFWLRGSPAVSAPYSERRSPGRSSASRSIRVGRIEYDALLPALVASMVGDVTRALGVRHTVYPTALPCTPTFLVLGELIAVGVAMALAAVAFVELTHGFKRMLQRRIPRLPVRMAVGGAAIVGLWRAVGSSDYLGLGVPTIVRALPIRICPSMPSP